MIGQLEPRVPMPIEGAPAHATGVFADSRGTEISDERRASWQARRFGFPGAVHHRKLPQPEDPTAHHGNFVHHWKTLWLCFSRRLARLDQFSTWPPALTATANANVVQPSSAGMRGSRFLTGFDCFSLLGAD